VRAVHATFVVALASGCAVVAPPRIAVALTSATVVPAQPDAPFRVSFPYRDAEFLYVGESNGGQVVVPSRVERGTHLPLVVLLHGVNPDHGPHMWMGGRDFPDLGLLVERMVGSYAAPPFLLAAPSQTKGAMSGHLMWKEFDLDDFVRAVEGAMGGRASVDRSTVIVMGHSGGGCNPAGGLLGVARAPRTVVPSAVVAIDTCLDEESGDALGRAPSDVEVLGGDPHESIVPDTFTSLVPSLLAAGTDDYDLPPGASDP
jgi:hypothetical protein